LREAESCDKRPEIFLILSWTFSLSTTSLKFQTTIRSWARRLGLISTLKRIESVLKRNGSRDESNFCSALLESVRKDDCVWDVGANVGFYSDLLEARVGGSGLVCAFEPAPHCYEVLRRQESKNLKVFNLALGQSETKLTLALDDNPLGTTHSLAQPASGASVTVEVMPGDLVLQRHGLRLPNVIKIDVEGFEEEVIAGLKNTLLNKECRAVFCEVHFSILDQRGQRHAPVRIEKALKRSGFSTRWVDSSHLAAIRN